jgi:hypothetical protein
MMNRFSLPKDEEPQVDSDQLREFAAGAKEHRTQQEPPPWEKYDPEELPKYNVSVRLNDYHMAILRHVAKLEDRSQQKILRGILVPALEEQVRVQADADK